MRKVIFEGDNLRVIAPLDPTEGRRHVELVRNGELDNLYNMTSLMDDYVNPIVNDVLSWKIITCCVLDSEESLEDWK